MAADGRTRVIRAGICVLAIMVSWWLLAGVASAAPTRCRTTIAGAAQEGQTLTLTQAPGPTRPLLRRSPISGRVALSLTAPGRTAEQLQLRSGRERSGAASRSSRPRRTRRVPPSVPNPATATSAPTAVVIANTAAPKITGIAQEGQILTLTKGSWLGAPTVKRPVGELCRRHLRCGRHAQQLDLRAGLNRREPHNRGSRDGHLPGPTRLDDHVGGGRADRPADDPRGHRAANDLGSGAARTGLTVAHGTWLNSPRHDHRPVGAV